MPGAVARDVARGDFHLELADRHAIVLVLGRRHPRIDRGRLRHGQRRARFQRRQVARRSADDGLQRVALVVQVIDGSKFLRQHQVVRGLRLVRIGDGLGADFKIALGRCQLLGGGVLLGAGRFQLVLRRQHVEVGLRHARDQVLLGLGKLGFADGLLQLALLVRFPAIPAIQRLLQRQRVFVGAQVRAAAANDARLAVRQGAELTDIPWIEITVVLAECTADANGRE